MQRWVEKYGFAVLVLVALSCSCYLAGTVKVPERIPDFALQAEEIYRLEVGAAFFAALYLAILTLLLALGGRGFAEFGTKGLKISKVVARTEVGLHQQIKIDLHTRAMLRELDADVRDIKARLAFHEQQLEGVDASS